MNRRQVLIGGGAAALLSCVRGGKSPVEMRQARGAIVACGQRFEVDAPVVLWHEAPFYSAYSVGPRFPRADGAGAEPIQGLRYGALRTFGGSDLERRLRERPDDLDLLREAVDLFVLHYDVCGTSRVCFDVLQDRRKLSVHFMLDVDGTIYQTLDLKERAWHAAHANSRSIGIEIAQIGAWPVGDDTLGRWYNEGVRGTKMTIPSRVPLGELAPNFDARPARPERVRGRIHDQEVEQYDFTPEQYRSLAALTATLFRVFPRIATTVPRDTAGAVRRDLLSDAEYQTYRGLIGHYHLSRNKIDPGPAFAWERLLSMATRRI